MTLSPIRIAVFEGRSSACKAGLRKKRQVGPDIDLTGAWRIEQKSAKPVPQNF
jgi:hypothetical protein